jgi:hypothetical protein
MHTRAVILAHSLFVAALLAMQSSEADDEALKKDLTAVIALQGLPCGEVVVVTVRAENDYAVSCKDNNRYHVYLNASGRVMVETQK